MRSAERELAEMERKKLAADAMSTSSARPRSSAELNKERMVELTHQIGLEAKRLAVSRGQLSKLKVASGPSITPTVLPLKGTSVSKEVAVKKAVVPSAHSHISNTTSTAIMGRPTSSTLPEGLLPELCKYVLNSYLLIFVYHTTLSESNLCLRLCFIKFATGTFLYQHIMKCHKMT